MRARQILSCVLMILFALAGVGIGMLNVSRDRKAWQDAVHVQGTISAIENREESGSERQVVRVSYIWQGETVEGVIEGCPGGLHVGDAVDMKVRTMWPNHPRWVGHERKMNGAMLLLFAMAGGTGTVNLLKLLLDQRSKRSEKDEKIWGLTRHVLAQVTACSRSPGVVMQPGGMFHITCRDREGRTFEKSAVLYSNMYIGLTGQWITVCIDPNNEARFWFDINGKLV